MSGPEIIGGGRTGMEETRTVSQQCAVSYPEINSAAATTTLQAKAQCTKRT